MLSGTCTKKQEMTKTLQEQKITITKYDIWWVFSFILEAHMLLYVPNNVLDVSEEEGGDKELSLDNFCRSKGDSAIDINWNTWMKLE